MAMADGLSYDPEKCSFSLPSSPATATSANTVQSQASGEPIVATAKSIAHRQNLISRVFNWLLGTLRKDLTCTTTCRKLEDCPSGYPSLAAFLSSDYNFTLYRGFSYLHARVLLMRQDELVVLERELDELDKDDRDEGREIHLKSRARDNIVARREQQERPRETILTEIHEKLLVYDEVLKNARDLAAFQKPSDRDYRSVRTWFKNEAPLVAKESQFIDCKEDIITLRNGRECAGFDGLVEAMLQKLNCPLVRYLFLTPELREKTSDKFIHYYSPQRIDKLVGLIITSVIFVLLVTPVVVMYKLTSFGNRDSTFRAIGVLIVFTLLFSAAMSLLTRARRHELFAASAAYCAVLVVFISNFGSLPS